ncbi:class II aldolase/adducin family protein [Thermosipho ferrireducens]|uniref:Class II aldolase/adducin family protein n=1 Tax=Thermosipho ferrireducens TaxID=2571116 RepID=A0ABX7S8A4_9BACT|nr:class II aldolase/adducin family protein [Thermosipho ferrireducens]QTA38138.1 class II aldolase/adducin family protein [Thermosipho ferrireducens]
MKKEILYAAKFIMENNLVKGSWGNISIKNGDKIYITPSGIPYDTLKEKDICVVTMDGKIIEGVKPSSELPAHLEIYRHREDVNAVVHTHPVFSTVVSIVAEYIPPLVEDAVMILGPKIYVSDYALPGTKELGENVVKALKDNHAVILRNHGLITVGSDLREALTASLVCEKTAEIFLYSIKMDKINLINEKDAIILRNKYLSAYRQINRDVR